MKYASILILTLVYLPSMLVLAKGYSIRDPHRDCDKAVRDYAQAVWDRDTVRYISAFTLSENMTVYSEYSMTLLNGQTLDQQTNGPAYGLNQSIELEIKTLGTFDQICFLDIILYPEFRSRNLRDVLLLDSIYRQLQTTLRFVIAIQSGDNFLFQNSYNQYEFGPKKSDKKICKIEHFRGVGDRIIATKQEVEQLLGKPLAKPVGNRRKYCRQLKKVYDQHIKAKLPNQNNVLLYQLM